MKVLLIDVDCRMPNLALMKWSAKHKSIGNTVFFEKSCDPSLVLLSCVFTWNRSNALGIAKMFSCPVMMGGSGIDLTTTLPDDVEHICPDYELYKERGEVYHGNLAKLNCQYDGSIAVGYTSRGCIRSCPFCLVPEKEGFIKDHAPITEFLADRDKVRLLDNNFLASPRWKENLAFIQDNHLKVCFDQGLDIRLINEGNATLLAETDFQNRNFHFKQLYFAWDQIQDEQYIRKGIDSLCLAGIRPRNLAFYMLVGFNTTFYEDMYRFKVLQELGVDPFVMLYNKQGGPVLKMFQRWVNKRIYKVSDFGQYTRKENGVGKALTEDYSS